MLCLRRLDVRRNLRSLGIRVADALLERAARGLAVASVLLVHLGLLLSIGLNLLLHGLEHCHNLANRVGRNARGALLTSLHAAGGQGSGNASRESYAIHGHDATFQRKD